MAEILVKAGDQSPHPAHFKDGDVVTVKDDGHTWGRCQSIDVWVAEGLQGKITTTNEITKETVTVDTSGETADTWPGGFDIIRIPGAPKEDYYYLLETGPVRVRGLPDYASLTKDGNVFVAEATAVDALSTDRIVKVADLAAVAAIKP